MEMNAIPKSVEADGRTLDTATAVLIASRPVGMMRAGGLFEPNWNIAAHLLRTPERRFFVQLRTEDPNGDDGALYAIPTRMALGWFRNAQQHVAEAHAFNAADIDEVRLQAEAWDHRAPFWASPI